MGYSLLSPVPIVYKEVPLPLFSPKFEIFYNWNKKVETPKNIDHLFFYYSQAGVLRVSSLNGFRLDVSGNRSIYEVAHPQFFLHAFDDN